VSCVFVPDEKKLGGALKKLGVQTIPGIEEVNLFKDNGEVIHFVQPKVQANLQSHTFVISGTADTKPIQAFLPGILNQLGPEGLAQLRKVAEAYPGAGLPADEDDDIPELVENFEDASTK
jgi:nascent polypeptide-associated complex subunit beta